MRVCAVFLVLADRVCDVYFPPHRASCPAYATSRFADLGRERWFRPYSFAIRNRRFEPSNQYCRPPGGPFACSLRLLPPLARSPRRMNRSRAGAGLKSPAGRTSCPAWHGGALQAWRVMLPGWRGGGVKRNRRFEPPSPYCRPPDGLHPAPENQQREVVELLHLAGEAEMVGHQGVDHLGGFVDFRRAKPFAHSLQPEHFPV